MNVLVVGEPPLAQESAQICSDAGHQVWSYITADGIDTLESIEGDAAAACDLAVELCNRSISTKRAALEAIDRAVSNRTPILSLSLATGVTEAASWIANPQRLVGFGLLPPVERPGMVELAAGLQTGQPYMDEAETFWRSLDLEPVRVAEGPGLVRARTVCCLINEAASALMDDIATAAGVDTAMRLGTNYPYGPLAWADIIGLDYVLAVMNGLFREWGEDRYRPAPLLKKMALAGMLGRHAGQGFYQYGPDGRREQ